MTSADLLTDAFERVHGLVHDAVRDVPIDKLHERLDSKANPIAWLIWHLTRVQDDHIADAAGTEQVWTAQDFYERFGLTLPVGSTGFAHSSSEVDAVKVNSAKLLTDYHDAVHDMTVRYVRELSDTDLDRVIDYNWSPPVTLGVRLVSVIGDTTQHAGQAEYLRGIFLRQ